MLNYRKPGVKLENSEKYLLGFHMAAYSVFNEKNIITQF